MKKIIIGSDHAGFELKEKIGEYLRQSGYSPEDIGIHKKPADTENCHYPLIAREAARRIVSGEFPLGILVCGTGIGMSIAANKVRGIRAAAVGSVTDARYARSHNDANILCLGERTMGEKTALEIVEKFLSTDFESEERHRKRIAMIAEMENE